MSTATESYCHLCDKLLFDSDSVSGHSLADSTRYGCLGKLKTKKFVDGLYMGGEFGCQEVDEQVKTLTLRFGSENDGIKIPADIEEEGQIRRVTLSVPNSLRDARRFALERGIDGLVYHPVKHGEGFLICAEDAEKAGYECPVCSDRLVQVYSDEFQNFKSMQAHKFMQENFPHLLGL